MRPHSFRIRLCAAALCLPLLAAAPANTPTHFASPDIAVDSLVTALRNGDRATLRSLFGDAGSQIVLSGDPVADAEAKEKFLAAYAAGHSIDAKSDAAMLLIGKDDWPFPIPLKHDAQGWTFDVAAGEDEILSRRIGANELYVQQVLLAYVDAQAEYAATLHDGQKLHVYAQRLISTPGKQDGLYWETAEGQKPSPLGPLVAGAQAEGYKARAKAAPAPYHGYYFRILTGQGPHAPGGAYSYVQNGQMFGGSGMVAWPAHWGNSGVMTFIVNQDGVVHQQDLGPDTAKIAAGITTYDPDADWQKIDVAPP